MQDFGAPSLITRQTNDVQQVQMLVLLSCTLMVMAPIMMVGGIIMAIREDLGLSWLIAVTVPVLAVALGFIISRMVPSFRLMQARIDEVNRLLREQITGVRVVRAFVREPLETERFATANQDLTTVAIRAGRWQALMFPTVMLVANVASVAVLWFGGHRVESGEMQIGALTAYLSYLLQIVMAVMMGTFMMMMIPRSAVCADRMMEVLDTDSSVRAGRRSRRRPARARHARASTASSSATPGPTRPSSRTSPSGPSPARPSPSSARPARARARWSTSCRASSTSPPARSRSTASTYDGSSPTSSGP